MICQCWVVHSQARWPPRCSLYVASSRCPSPVASSRCPSPVASSVNRKAHNTPIKSRSVPSSSCTAITQVKPLKSYPVRTSHVKKRWAAYCHKRARILMIPCMASICNWWWESYTKMEKIRSTLCQLRDGRDARVCCEIDKHQMNVVGGDAILAGVNNFLTAQSLMWGLISSREDVCQIHCQQESIIVVGFNKQVF